MKFRYIQASTLLSIVVIIFNIVPGIYILSNCYFEGLYRSIDTEQYARAVRLYMYSVLLFTLVYWLTLYSIKVTLLSNVKDYGGKVFFRPSLYPHLSIGDSFEFIIRKSARVVNIGIVSCIIVWMYFLFGGYQKLLLYGQDIDAWEFRIIGYADRNILLSVGLELARRTFLPFVCLYLISLRSFTRTTKKSTIYFFLFSLLLAGVMTLDRGPILLFLIIFVYKKYCFSQRLTELIGMLLLAFLIVIVGGGLVTFIQYNITEFSLEDVLKTSFAFFWHRALLVPSIASIELSFYIFPEGSDKLYLEFSRLGALIGREYISIRTAEKSLYVTPVGFIADIWRNFGRLGIVFVAVLLGIYMSYVDYLIKMSDPITKIAASFTAFSLSFFLIFGVFFSQGVLAQMVLLVVFLKMLKIDRRRYYLHL